MGLAGLEGRAYHAGRRWIPVLAGLVAALSAAGCSITMPMMSLTGDPDTTGSIANDALSRDFDAQDRKLSANAIDTALNPLRPAGPVPWTNPASGLHGTISPTGEAFVTEEQVCRWFNATVASSRPGVELAGKPARLTGYACRVGGGSWTIRRVQQAEAEQG